MLSGSLSQYGDYTAAATQLQYTIIITYYILVKYLRTLNTLFYLVDFITVDLKVILMYFKMKLIY